MVQKRIREVIIKSGNILNRTERIIQKKEITGSFKLMQTRRM